MLAKQIQMLAIAVALLSQVGNANEEKSNNDIAAERPAPCFCLQDKTSGTLIKHIKRCDPVGPQWQKKVLCQDYSDEEYTVPNSDGWRTINGGEGACPMCISNVETGIGSDIEVPRGNDLKTKSASEDHNNASQ